MTETATLYRMESDSHTCPFGLRARDLLNRKGFAVSDRVLTSREQVDATKLELDVATLPQVIIGGERIGGFEDLQRHLGAKPGGKGEVTYFPVVAVFAVSALLVAATHYPFSAPSLTFEQILMQFVGISMVLLGLLKLQNLQGFVNGFLGYDLLAKRYVPYAFIYPFAEVVGGLLMISNSLPALSIPLMLFIGGIGGVSVVKAVYIDQRELKCACVGGDSNVPLGFVSFLENAVMFCAGVWMLLKIAVI